MTTKQYLAALKRLGLTPASKGTADALGLSLRHCQRLAAGTPIPEPVAIILQLRLAACEREREQRPIDASGHEPRS